MMRLLLGALALFATACTTTPKTYPEQVHIGPLETRALWFPADETAASSASKRPVIILLPGSGPNGPEEMIPASETIDNKPHGEFVELANALQKGGLNVLAVGKPGIEFYDPKLLLPYYQIDRYTNLKWQDLQDQITADMAWLKQQPGVDPSRIYLLGHSEGTQLSVDFAKTHPDVKGLVLLGYAGQNIRKLLHWQLYDRGRIWGKDESAKPDDHAEPIMRMIDSIPLYQGVADRPDLYEETAALKQPLWVYNGEFDLQTPVTQVTPLKDACLRHRKTNCQIIIVPKVGHGFSVPRPPRSDPLLDITLGPPDPAFLRTMTELGRDLAKAP